MNIYDALNEYKQYLLIEKKVSDNTLKNYMRDLEHFINYIQKQNQVVLIDQIDITGAPIKLVAETMMIIMYINEHNRYEFS